MKKGNKAYLYLAITILIWASASATSKLLLRNLNNVQVLFFNTLFASATLFLIALFSNKLQIIKSYKAKDYLVFLYMGCLGVFVYYLCSFGSLMLIPAQQSTVINYLWPIMVLIFASIILKEKMTIYKILAMALSFLGVYIVVTQGKIFQLTFLNPFGVLLRIIAAVSYGLFSVLGKRFKYEEITSLFFYYFFSFLLTCLLIPFGYPIQAINKIEFFGLLWLGSFVSGIAYIFWLLALKNGDTSKIVNLVYLVPFLALVYIYILVGETILPSTIVGLVIIILGIFIQHLSPQGKK